MSNITIKFRGQKFNLNVKELSYIGQFRGLMFRSKNSDNLLFNRGGTWSIHSLYVFFPFLAVWLDENNNVLECRMIKPFILSAKPKTAFSKLIEIPMNDKNKEQINKLLL